MSKRRTGYFFYFFKCSEVANSFQIFNTVIKSGQMQTIIVIKSAMYCAFFVIKSDMFKKKIFFYTLKIFPCWRICNTFLNHCRQIALKNTSRLTYSFPTVFWGCSCSKCIPSTNPVLPDALLIPTFAPCERIRKPVRQLTDTAKRRPARTLNFLF